MPIIVVSARGQEEHKIAALDGGANDYVTKPFVAGELLARIRVALRNRPDEEDEPTGYVMVGNLTVDFDMRRVTVSGVEVSVTPTEYRLLGMLILAAGRVLTHRQLLCCTDHNCTIDEPDACADGSERPILASNYDQSCTTDTDCMAIGEGNACSLVGPCPSAAINKGAYSQYQSDVAQTPCYGLSGCPSGSGPCCRHGTCGLNAACYSAADTLPACADAGGTCQPFVSGCGSMGAGPPDACAYSDETCCLQ